MAQTLTLEQAADRLGLSHEEFKRRLREDWATTLKKFRDGPTFRFRTVDIDELARSLGEASDPGVPLGVGAVPLTDSSEEIPIAIPPKPKAPEPLLALDDDTAESADDIFAVPTGDSGVGKGGKKKSTGDSDVRLDLTPTKPRSDSEITEEISLELPSAGGSGVLKSPSSVKMGGPASGKNGPASGKLGGPRSGKLTAADSARIPGPGSVPAGDDGSSEFELSLDSDSDSFELTLNTDSSEEVDLGVMPVDDGGRGKSGIKLDQPADQGLSLERSGTDDDSDIEFELTLDAPGPASGKLAGPKTDKKKKKADDSDSEFELSLDDNSGVTDGLVEELNAEEDKGDIFETDFELPVIADDESGSEVIAVESADTDLENSDFDIAIEDSDAPMDDESASQVVMVDDSDGDVVPLEDDDAMVLSDDDAQPVTPSRKRRGMVAGDDDDVLIGEVELDDGPSASKALRGVRRDEDDMPIRTVAAGPPKWGPLPALFLLPCLIVVVLGGLMMFEMVRGQWGYTQPSKPSDALVRGVAKTLDMKVSE